MLYHCCRSKVRIARRLSSMTACACVTRVRVCIFVCRFTVCPIVFPFSSSTSSSSSFLMPRSRARRHALICCYNTAISGSAAVIQCGCAIVLRRAREPRVSRATAGLHLRNARCSNYTAILNSFASTRNGALIADQLNPQFTVRFRPSIPRNCTQKYIIPLLRKAVSLLSDK